MRTDKLFIGATVLAVAGLASAGPERSPGHGAVTVDRAVPAGASSMKARTLKERIAARFSEADGNGDGRLDVDEVQAMLTRMRAERSIQWLDRDGDGAVSRAEFARSAGEPGVGMEHDAAVGNRDYDDYDDYEDEDDEDDEDEGNATAGPAPAGTTAPPNNGLFAPDSTPKVNTN